MQAQILKPEHKDFSKLKVLIGISGGINSAALICYLASEYPKELQPKEVHLFAVQLKEHSPDTFSFMKDCIRYAASHFDCIRWKVKWGSALKFFKNENMIPHPILSPCSEQLKIIPMLEYTEEHNIDLDLIGYVRTEQNRISKQLKKAKDKYHPIAHLSDEDCFSLVDREIGWHPAIYDIKEWRGKKYKRVFTHNNCLVCKNMSGYLKPDGEVKGQYADVKLYYPEYYEKSLATAQKIRSYWGRVKKDENNDDFGACQICMFM